MSRYVDADKLKENRTMRDRDGNPYGEKCYVTFDEIDKAPTEDVVRVVRCKDCKHSFMSMNHRHCELHGTFCFSPLVRDDGFCSEGKERGVHDYE